MVESTVRRVLSSGKYGIDRLRSDPAVLQSAVDAAHRLIPLPLRWIIGRARVETAFRGAISLTEGRVTRSPDATKSHPTVAGAFQEEVSMSEPRNYLAEATGFVKAPRPLPELLEINRKEVIHNLVRSLDFEEGMMSAQVRKAAAYALGQIGEPATLGALKSRHGREQAPGVKDAIVAAATAINLAPDGPEHSQLERRQIISDVYDGRRTADF